MPYLARRLSLVAVVTMAMGAFCASGAITPVRAADPAAPAHADATRSWGAYKSDHPVQFDNPMDSGEITDMSELTRHLMRAASRLSKYRMADAMPMVRRVTRLDLEARACPHGGGRCGVSALYLPELGILMAEDLKPETNLFQRSILLHEVVHYLQDVGHELLSASLCERWYQRELEAYAIQKQYLVSINSPDRVAYSGTRPTCDNDTAAQTHQAKVIKAPTIND